MVIPAMSSKVLGKDSGLYARLVNRNGELLGYQFRVCDEKYIVEMLDDEGSSKDHTYWPFTMGVVVTNETDAKLPSVCIDDVFKDGYLHVITCSTITHIKTDKAEEFGRLLMNIHGVLDEGRFLETWPMAHYRQFTVLDYSIALSVEVNENPGRTGYPTVEKISKWFVDQGVNGVKVRVTSVERGRGQTKNTFSILFPLTTSFSKTTFKRKTYRMATEISNDYYSPTVVPEVYKISLDGSKKLPLYLWGTTREREIVNGPSPNGICKVQNVSAPNGLKVFAWDDKEVDKVRDYANFFAVTCFETNIKNCFALYYINRPYPFCVNHSRPLIKEAKEIVEDIPLLNDICKAPVEFSGFDSVLSTGYKRYEAKVELGELDENLPFSDSDLNTELNSILEEVMLKHELLLVKFNYPVNKITTRLFSKNGKITLSMQVTTGGGASSGH